MRCGLLAVIGIFMGSGSHAHRDTISTAIVIKSRRKGLLVTSAAKRGRLCSKEKGIERSVLIMGNALVCGGSIPGHCSFRNTVELLPSRVLRRVPR